MWVIVVVDRPCCLSLGSTYIIMRNPSPSFSGGGRSSMSVNCWNGFPDSPP